MTLANSYLDRDGLKLRSVLPASLIDGTFIPADKAADRTAWQSFVDTRLQVHTSKINARLDKRYVVPFGSDGSPVPEIVLGWLAALVAPDVYRKRGWDPSDEQAKAIVADAELALAEMKEAADSENGLFDLPLRNDQANASAIANGSPNAYSEASPFSWTDVQADTITGGGV